MEVHAVKITDTLRAPVDPQLLSMVSAQRREGIQRFRNVADAQRSLHAELLLRVILRMKGIPSGKIQFKVNANGKPSLVNFPELHFNISHSGEWVVCALDCEPVGVDVEAIQPIDYAIADRYFSAQENERLLRQPEKDKLAYFYDIWTLKESYIKAKGKGLSLLLHSFSIMKEDRAICLEFPNEDAAGYCFKQFDIDSGYKFSLCGVNARSADNVLIWTCSQLDGLG